MITQQPKTTENLNIFDIKTKTIDHLKPTIDHLNYLRP